MGEHGVPGRGADGLADALQQQETRGDFPAPRQSQQGHRQQVQAIARKGDGPVFPHPVGEVTGDQAQGYPRNSPKPATIATMKTLAWRLPKNGPLMLRAPS
jgi:hypothetical protein